jgi:DNA topoisomerase-2
MQSTPIVKTPKPTYQRLELHTQILKRPDTYIESTHLRETETWVVEDGRIVFKTVTIPQGLVNTFQEILSNAIDNVWRSIESEKPCRKIAVDFNYDTGMISVWNDGQTIPVEKTNDIDLGELWNPELIFGVLLTSSNYDDNEERKTSGRNGYGAKLTNIFSSYFCIETHDVNNGLLYKQEWKDNMHYVRDPVIIEKKGKTGYTKISWIPDFKRFNSNSLSKDTISVIEKHIYDSVVATKVKTFLNGKLLPFNTIVGYSKTYGVTEEIMSFTSKDSDVVIIPWNSHHVVSFVNGKNTARGGVHVESWIESLFRPIVNIINKKGEKKKKPTIDIRDIKRFFLVIINSSLIRPEFSSQTKDELVSPKVETSVPSSKISKIMKWQFIEKVEDIIRGKEFSSLKKTSKNKKGEVVSGLDHANLAGGSRSMECCLVITEGLSAKTFVVKGLKQGFKIGDKVFSGRDYIGILPIRGKFFNPRGKSIKTIALKKELSALVQTIGLQYDIDYSVDANFKKLNYGFIAIVTDADVDGDHIKGLVMNSLETLFPSLLQRETSFVVSMLTPITRVFIPKKQPLVFYEEANFSKFVNENPNLNFKVKYYKGLGSSEDKEIVQVYGKRMVEYYYDDSSYDTFRKVFEKTESDQRKRWLADFDPDQSLNIEDEKDQEKQQELEQVSFTDFFDNKMIRFSFDHCRRSIPNVIDGLKQSMRKILYACIKRKLSYKGKPLKTAQLAGYVAEHTNYRHGEKCLEDTINGLVARYIGSNNIPLLSPNGQFGTRISGGKDAASGRYTSTKMDTLTQCVFPIKDYDLPEKLIEDGDVVEPIFYLPVIPMILVNGCTAGIGTGWSSTIPCYNPLDVIRNTRTCILKDGDVMHSVGDLEFTELDDLVPWYYGFTGTIIESSPTRYTTSGIVVRKGPLKVKVTELPVGMWIDKFSDYLKSLKISKMIKKFEDHTTATDVDFTIYELKDGIKCTVESLKLTSYLYTSNIVAFNTQDKITRYTICSIFVEFYHTRISYYEKRRYKIITDMKDKHQEASNKYRFISEIIENTLNIMRRDENDLDTELVKKQYERRFTKKRKEDILANGNENQNEGGFEYLKRLPVSSFTKQKLEKLAQEKEKALCSINEATGTTAKQMWLSELAEFETVYLKWVNSRKA